MQKCLQYDFKSSIASTSIILAPVLLYKYKPIDICQLRTRNNSADM